MKPNEVFYKMKDFRILYIISVAVWALWGIFTGAILCVYLTEGATAGEWAVGIAVIAALFSVLLGVIPFVKYRAKRKIDRHLKDRLLENAAAYLSNVGGDFWGQMQEDLNKGLLFMEKHNPVISRRYIFGSIKELGLDPIAIPREQIREIAYAIYEQLFHIRGIHWGLALEALRGCGVKMVDISPKRNGYSCK